MNFPTDVPARGTVTPQASLVQARDCRAIQASTPASRNDRADGDILAQVADPLWAGHGVKIRTLQTLQVRLKEAKALERGISHQKTCVTTRSIPNTSSVTVCSS